MLQFAAPWLFLLLPLPWLLRKGLPEYREARPAVLVPIIERLKRVTGDAGAIVLFQVLSKCTASSRSPAACIRCTR